MGRTTSEENKGEVFRFRIKPSLKKRIKEVQARGDCNDLELQDFIVVLIRRGLYVQEKINEWSTRLTINQAKDVKAADDKGGAARRETRQPSLTKER